MFFEPRLSFLYEKKLKPYLKITFKNLSFSQKKAGSQKV